MEGSHGLGGSPSQQEAVLAPGLHFIPSSMRPTVFYIRPTQCGWLVLEGERIAELLSTRFWAIKAAEGLAYARHAATGAPTSVIVETIDDSIVAATFG